MKFSKVFFLLSLIFLSSCTEENIDEAIPKNENIDNSRIIMGKDSIGLSNGRLVFETAEQFDNLMQSLKNKEEHEIANILQYYYEQGFMPSYAYYDAEDYEKFSIFFKERKKYTPESIYLEEEMEVSDPLISDDLFASFLNVKREIQIGSKIYAYTFSGLYIVDEKDYNLLENHITNNNIYDKTPNLATIQKGLYTIADGIEVFVEPKVLAVDDCGPVAYDGGMGNSINMDDESCFSSGGGGPTNDNSNNPPPDHTSSLVNYISDLQECDKKQIWSVAGVRYKCKEYFGSNRRTKTLYYNENYLFYSAIGVKVKHQRHHSAYVTDWWATKKTDEVALIINQATFRTKLSANIPNYGNFNIPTNNGVPAQIYYVGNIAYQNTSNGPSVQGQIVPGNLKPSTPFNEDVIVQFFNNNISLSSDMAIVAQDVNDIFWDQVWAQAKSLFQSLEGEDPKRVTMILSNQNTTIVNYVDLERRKSNTKKIHRVLDYNWGVSFKFNASLDGNNNIITNPSQFANYSNYSIQMPNLTKFEGINMDFVGVTRRGNTWKGSKMVYKLN